MNHKKKSSLLSITTVFKFDENDLIWLMIIYSINEIYDAWIFEIYNYHNTSSYDRHIKSPSGKKTIKVL